MGAATTSSNKRLVHALVDDVINARRVVDEPATAGSRVKLRSAVEQFLASFPDWHQQVVEFVEEGDSVVAHFRVHGPTSRRRCSTPTTPFIATATATARVIALRQARTAA